MNSLQLKILEIFKEVAKVCDENGIPYYAIGGTCIGAVRHKGFIPWDDDLDIAIPIEYFDKFTECAEKQLPSNLKLRTGDEAPHYKNIFIKVHDVNTTFIEKLEAKYPDVHKGVFVDVMPISGIPDGESEKRKFVKRIERWQVLNFIRRYPYNEMYSPKTKLIWILMHLFCFWMPANFYSRKWMRLLKKYPLKDAKITGCTWDSSVSKVMVPAKCFLQTVKLPFEDTEMSCPIGYDEYLTVQFGDYMTPPPEDKRAVHHTELVDIHQPYLKNNITE